MNTTIETTPASPTDWAQEKRDMRSVLKTFKKQDARGEFPSVRENAADADRVRKGLAANEAWNAKCRAVWSPGR